jgi:hypothetical protein
VIDCRTLEPTITVIMAPITRSASRKASKFSSLPTELRLMIWTETFQPRILHITIERTDPVFKRKSSRHRVVLKRTPRRLRFKSRDKPPVALQICHESRALALKHYTPSFHSTTGFATHACEHLFKAAKKTALYFSPELDTVHISNDEHNTEFWNLFYRAETIQSIKVLAIGSQLFRDEWMQYVAGRLPAFETLETLILVVERKLERTGVELIQVNMEGYLAKAQDQLILLGRCKEWKSPLVKVMTRRGFENHL